MKWFKHYSKAHEDRAIQRLLIEYGATGYALYFYCLEMIAADLEADNVSFELDPDAEAIAYALHIQPEQAKQITHRCIELGLFELSDSGHIACPKMAKFFDQKMTSNPEMRKVFSKVESQVSHKSVIDQSQVSHKSVIEVGDQIRLDKNRLEEKKNKENDSTISPNTKKAGISRIEAARNLWNTKGNLPQYRFIATAMKPDELSAALRTMGAYTDEEIVKAIENYSSILNSQDYEAFPKYIGFAGFLRSGPESYGDDAQPFVRCRKKDDQDEDPAALLKRLRGEA